MSTGEELWRHATSRITLNATLLAQRAQALRGTAAARLGMFPLIADIPRMGQPPCRLAVRVEEARPKAAALPCALCAAKMALTSPNILYTTSPFQDWG